MPSNGRPLEEEEDLPAQLGEIRNVKSALFSEDLVICTLLPKQEHQLSKIMNEALTALSNWCYENVRTINTKKTFYYS
jgi:hypothetical protein